MEPLVILFVIGCLFVIGVAYLFSNKKKSKELNANKKCLKNASNRKSELAKRKHFEQWLKLRDCHRFAKREKDYRKVINTGKDILKLSKKSPEIRIVDALFLHDIADAHIKLGNKQFAIKYLKEAIRAFEIYRATSRLRSSDDFLIDVERLKKKLNKIISVT